MLRKVRPLAWKRFIKMGCFSREVPEMEGNHSETLQFQCWNDSHAWSWHW